MPRKKKPATELTTDEAITRLFPKKIVTKMKEEAEKASNKATKRDTK
jgi:hypothetical protein